MILKRVQGSSEAVPIDWRGMGADVICQERSQPLVPFPLRLHLDHLKKRVRATRADVPVPPLPFLLQL